MGFWGKLEYRTGECGREPCDSGTAREVYPASDIDADSPIGVPIGLLTVEHFLFLGKILGLILL
jgi:hypothetical protein